MNHVIRGRIVIRIHTQNYDYMYVAGFLIDVPVLLCRSYFLLPRNHVPDYVLLVLAVIVQLDWPWIAEWAYAGIFAVAVRFQNKDQFWIPH